MKRVRFAQQTTILANIEFAHARHARFVAAAAAVILGSFVRHIFPDSFPAPSKVAPNLLEQWRSCYRRGIGGLFTCSELRRRSEEDVTVNRISCVTKFGDLFSYLREEVYFDINET